MKKTRSENTNRFPCGMTFQAATALNTDKHRDRMIDLTFVRERIGQVPYCQINVGEFQQSAHWFPIVFSVEAPYVPFVIMSLEKERNLFSDLLHGWHGGIYMPLGVAQYPVCVSGAQIEGKGWPISIDTSSFSAAGQEGQPLFEESQATSYLDDRIAHSRYYAGGQASTAKFVSIIKALDLFKRVNQKIETAQGPLSMGSFMVVDIEKLNALPDEKKRSLKQTGAWQYVEMHVASLSNFERLIERTEKSNLNKIQ